MVNTDYKIEAIALLLNEKCILKGYYPLIPHRDSLVEGLRRLGCIRKEQALSCSDQELREALPDAGLVGLLRKFLTMYDPRPGKMREISSAAETPEEEGVFGELYLLPGVKSTRARLYMLAGYGVLADIAAATAEELIAACEKVIAQMRLAQKPPLMKEARTHIAVARAFTDALEERKE